VTRSIPIDTVASGIPPYATVLFDLDGTLTDPLDGIANALAYALDKLGRPPVDRVTVARLIGPPYTDGYVRILGMTPAEAEETIAVYREYYTDRGLFENSLYDGILELLTGLADAGVRCAVATSKPTVYADRIIDHFGLRDLVAFVGGATLDGKRSLKADVVAHALAELGDPARASTVMVGDRHHDVIGAAAHGIGCIGALWGYGTEAELVDAGAIAVAESPKALSLLLA
jgi:phosphoglycolate phosphatase